MAKDSTESRSCGWCGGNLDGTHGNRRFCAKRCAFWAKVDRAGGDESCWPWTSAIGGRSHRWNCYGQFSFYENGVCSVVRAHRFAYEDAHGPIGHNRFVCHICDNPLCCNPSHLFLGVPAENSADMVRKGRSLRGVDTTPAGTRARGERNGSAKLNPEKIRAIRAESVRGTGSRALARMFGISRSNARRIADRTAWSHVA